MTVKIPKPNFFDKLLKFLGKKRGVIVPTNAYEKYGQYVYASCQRESFWKALFRPKERDLPEDYVDIYTLQDQRGYHSEDSSKNYSHNGMGFSNDKKPPSFC